MANMSYCRFENTAQDIDDCLEAVVEASENDMPFETFVEKLSSSSERRAFQLMYEKCQAFVDAYEKLKEVSR